MSHSSENHPLQLNAKTQIASHFPSYTKYGIFVWTGLRAREKGTDIKYNFEDS